MRKNLIKTLFIAVIIEATVLTTGISAQAAEATTTQTTNQIKLTEASKAALKSVFDAKYYAEQNPDVVAVVGNSETALFNHYITSGINEGRDASATFKVGFYALANYDLSTVYGDDINRYIDHYVNHGIKENRVGSINALSTEEAQQAVTEAFYSSIEQYLDGDLTAEEAKAKIAQLLADYVNSSSAFTNYQKTEINDIISQYLADIDLENILTNQGEAIEQINNTFEKYVKQNEQTIKLLQQTLEEEINNNMTYTQEQLDILNDLHTELTNLEAKHFANTSTYISETINRFEEIRRQTEYNTYNSIKKWEANKEYDINTFVLYTVTETHYSSSTDSIGRYDGYNLETTHLYQNLTGVNTDVTPDKDTTNWREVSLAKSIQNIFNIISGGNTMGYDEWLKNHTTDADGTVIDQYVVYDNYIYQNISGTFNPDVTPDKDSDNWKKLSATDAIAENFQTMLDDLYGKVESFTEWMNSREENPGGGYRDQMCVYKNKLYINITGKVNEDPSVTPDKDTENWQDFSLTGAVEKYYETVIEKLYSGIKGWSAEGVYKPSSYAMYNGKLYRNKTGKNTSVNPEEDTANWEESSIMTVVQNTYNTFLAATGAKDYVDADTYKAGDYVVFNNVIYKNVSDNPDANNAISIPGVANPDFTGAGTQPIWKAVSITAMIDQNYKTFANAVGAEDYNNEHSYQAGDYVLYDGKLYRAKDVATGAFDANKWEEVAITTQIENLNRDVEELKVQTSTTLEALDKNLTELIKDNKSLTDKQKEDMLAVLAATKEAGDASEAALADLKTQLESIMASECNENEKERAKITEQLNALENNTASYMYDYELRIKKLEDRTTTTTNGQEFQYDYQNGAYGYTVDGVFHPF